MLDKIDYDLNIFMTEIFDDRAGEFYYEPASWRLHVYAVDESGHYEMDQARALTQDEIISLKLNNDKYFKDVDAWYGMEGFLKDYKDVIPDSILEYLRSFPEYSVDKAIKTR